MLSNLTAFAAAHPHLAYGAVFLLALSEAIPVIGAVVPGSALIIGISALAPQGVVSIWPLLLFGTVGAIAGDGISYWLGHRYGAAILGRWPLSGHQAFVANSQAFMERHGGASVFLARFTPGVRAFVPWLAGILGMPARRFYIANVLSALAWAPAHILSGLGIGATIGAIGAEADPAVALLAAILLVLWLLLLAVRAARHRGARRIGR